MSTAPMQTPVWPIGPPSPSYVGWSQRNQRLEMMDLPTYLESLQQGYQRLTDTYQSSLGMPGAYPAGPTAASWGTGRAEDPTPGDSGSRRRRHGHRHDCGCGDGHGQGGCGNEHGHERGHGGCEHCGDYTPTRGHDRDCGCGGHDHEDRGERRPRRERGHGCGCREEPSCRCECCVEDADVIVYAHCGERRVVPIAVENDTRRDRENVTVEVSELRTAGGRVLPWRVVATPPGPLTLRSCSTTRLELVIGIACADREQGKEGDDQAAVDREHPASDNPDRGTLDTGDVDQCLVGYVTLRLGGCVTRPIVVAVAVLPDSCGSYHTACACSHC